MKNHAVLLFALACVSVPIAENMVFPADAGLIDVTQAPYSLKHDGATDNTAVLQRAFLDLRGLNRILYFPNGTYLFSNRVNISGDTPSTANSRDRFLNMQGQSENGVVLKLKDHAPGYDRPDSIKTFISLYDGQLTADVMHTYVRNITFAIGQGNTGAAALRYLAHNTGAIYNVTIRSLDSLKRGAIGLDLRQYMEGPALVKNVTVDGFDNGIQMDSCFSMVFEHINLRDQRKAGFYNHQARSTLRDLVSNNSVPALVNDAGGQATLIGATLAGSGEAAIVTVVPKLLCRDVTVSGYSHSVKSSAGTYIDGTITEWYDGTGYSLFGATPATLRLPIVETPEIAWETNLAKWVKVPEGQDQIQGAIDLAATQGATTVYFPKLGPGNGEGRYRITKPVSVHGSVNRIIALENIVDVSDPDSSFKKGAAVFTIENCTSPVISFERFFMLGGWNCPIYAYAFENKSNKTIVVRNSDIMGITKKSNPGGTWFFEDVSPGRESTLLIGAGESVWARQYNPETYLADMIHVDGGNLWILGLKTEGRTNHITASNGAKVELLGSNSFQSWINQALDPPMFIVDETSAASFTFGCNSFSQPFTTIVQETRGGQTKKLLATQLQNSYMPVYRTGPSSTRASLPLSTRQYYSRKSFVCTISAHQSLWLRIPSDAAGIDVCTFSGQLIRRYSTREYRNHEVSLKDIPGLIHGVVIINYVTR